MVQLANRRADLSLVTGVICGMLMILFFLASRWFHFDYIVELHFLNIVFIAPAIWFSTWQYHRRNDSVYPYLSGLMVGMKTVIGAAAVSNFFLLLYLRFINVPFMHFLKAHAPLGTYMTPLLIALVLLTEQVCAGLIITLIVMQLYKNRNTS